MSLIDIIVPESSEEGTESVVGAWLKKVGDSVSRNEPLLELSTDKVNLEIPSPSDGVLAEILKAENDSVEPGEVLGKIRSGAQEVKETEVERVTTVAAGRPAAEPTREVRLSPSVRRLVKQHGIDVSVLSGSGRGGRITLADVEEHLRVRPGAKPPGKGDFGTSRRVPHSPMRLQIASHMVESMLRTAPHVTSVFEVDMTRVLAHRSGSKQAFEEQGVRLTLTAYFVSAAAAASGEVPEVNSRWHDDGLELLSDCNVGVAAAVNGGLIVPVVRRAQRLSLIEIARALQDVTTRARAGKLSTEDVQGGTLTLTNHGVSGSLIATPIINQPQSAILGIGKLQKRVIVSEVDGVDSLQIKPMIYVTLTIDHRALDGFQANRFLTRFVNVLESWDAN